MNETLVEKDFTQQVETLIQKDYPAVAGISTEKFITLLQPLAQKIRNATISSVNIELGQLSFVLVITSTLIPTEKAMSLITRDGKAGVTKLFPHTAKDFTPIESVSIPSGPAYLLIDIDRGKDTTNVPPNEALKKIAHNNRSPITIDEGIAILTQYPDFLQKNNCFSLLASRHPGDKRVPAIWINAQKAPNLGWCWEGNPHTWLGSASCKMRIGV